MRNVVHAVVEMYFGGEESSGVHHQSLTCPYCGQMGLTNVDLLNHVDEEHPDNTQEVVQTSVSNLVLSCFHWPMFLVTAVGQVELWAIVGYANSCCGLLVVFTNVADWHMWNRAAYFPGMNPGWGTKLCQVNSGTYAYLDLVPAMPVGTLGSSLTPERMIHRSVFDVGSHQVLLERPAPCLLWTSSSSHICYRINILGSQLSPSSINLVLVQAGKVAVDLASHWPCITYNSGTTIYGSWPRKGDEHPAYTSVGVWHTLPFFADWRCH